MAQIVQLIIGNVLRPGGSGSVTVVDDLTSSSTTSALSANQGRVLKGLIDTLDPDAGAVPAENITQDATHRFVTDTEKTTWNGKQNALGFTPVSTDDSRLSDARTPLAHQHAMTDVTGLTAALADKADATTVTSGLAGKVNKEDGKGLSSNDFTSAEKSKLAGLESPKYQGTFVSLSALQAANVGGAGNYAYVDEGEGVEVAAYIWDDNDSAWVIQKGTSTAETAASIKTKYESNPDTNAFTDSEKTKLEGLSNYDDTTLSAAVANLGTTKADADSVYTKTEADALLAGKAASVHTHSIAQVTGLQTELDAKAAASNVYTKSEADSLLGDKADQATTYTKTETNDLLSPFTGAALPGDISGYPDGKVFIID